MHSAYPVGFTYTQALSGPQAMFGGLSDEMFVIDNALISNNLGRRPVL